MASVRVLQPRVKKRDLFHSALGYLNFASRAETRTFQVRGLHVREKPDPVHPYRDQDRDRSPDVGHFVDDDQHEGREGDEDREGVDLGRRESG